MRRRPDRRRELILALAALPFLGCVTRHELAYSPEQLRSEVHARVPQLPETQIIVPYEVNPALVETARRATRPYADAHSKALALARSLSNPKWFGLRYQWATSGSAAETIATGYGNCLALSSVYIGLARGLGLNAHYIDASRRPERQLHGDVAVSAGHIAVAVTSPGNVTLVDFSGQVAPHHLFRRLDDLEALAHLYNNRGYEVIEQATSRGEPIPWEDARGYFKLATQVQPDFARAWNNLGIAYGRLGSTEEAKRTYQAALAHDPRLSAAHLNLGNLHLGAGNLEAALVSLEAAAQLDRRNPFIHYLKGVVLLQSGSLADAEKSLSRSLRLKRDFIDARALLDDVRHKREHAERGLEN